LFSCSVLPMAVTLRSCELVVPGIAFPMELAQRICPGLKIVNTFYQFTAGGSSSFRRSKSAPARASSGYRRSESPARSVGKGDSDEAETDVGSEITENSADSDSDLGTEEGTGIVLKDVPGDLSLDDLVWSLYNLGFRVNFAYLPLNRKTNKIFGFVFVNLSSAIEAQMLEQHVEENGLAYEGLPLQVHVGRGERWRTSARNESPPMRSLEDCQARYGPGCDVWCKDPEEHRPACFSEGLRSDTWGYSTEAARATTPSRKTRKRRHAKKKGQPAGA